MAIKHADNRYRSYPSFGRLINQCKKDLLARYLQGYLARIFARSRGWILMNSKKVENEVPLRPPNKNTTFLWTKIIKQYLKIHQL
jgi:hypothetical protein